MATLAEGDFPGGAVNPSEGTVEIGNGSVLCELARHIKTESAVAVAGVNADHLRPGEGRSEEQAGRKTAGEIGLPPVIALGCHGNEVTAVHVDSELGEKRPPVSAGAGNQAGVG